MTSLQSRLALLFFSLSLPQPIGASFWTSTLQLTCMWFSQKRVNLGRQFPPPRLFWLSYPNVFCFLSFLFKSVFLTFFPSLWPQAIWISLAFPTQANRPFLLKILSWTSVDLLASRSFIRRFWQPPPLNHMFVLMLFRLPSYLPVQVLSSNALWQQVFFPK